MASSPTPRDELDEKLELAISQNIQFEHISTPTERDVMAVSINGSWIRLHVPYEQIKQAFKDAGYMTGQEWYDRFVKEMESGSDYPQPQGIKTHEALVQFFDLLMKTAAKRAAGIKD